MMNPIEVAGILDVDLASASELCAGVIEFEDYELVRLAEFYGVSVGEIVKEVVGA